MKETLKAKARDFDPGILEEDVPGVTREAFLAWVDAEIDALSPEQAAFVANGPLATPEILARVIQTSKKIRG